ncbi:MULTISPECIES: glycerophosphodiester phosphodiesterase [unclassified Bacillus (in: firmicutes)]|uniref:glycerophosphodiester phosphodiesterase n=1 Tax=unclassified Bacillus (in: firmicutes) TaxID=185979 RepID=UPI00227F59D4|nr:glycerophosphodiester phosphodiesterase [Bacillus sp. S20C3]MCY8205016.1 glycerophosphodiester phosphodiesterase [Bacillus sp. N12A5]MCY8289232.1 glycerophosphodiester phosphodiesterase [Bacillus sp. N13C7]MCY8636412.1 glycerophosphodiester phosphodiesterase [Bacillus sp. S17B2]MCY8720997.1 glycerophosphodiester phosphodiesterase [Bacillus sp. S10C12M]MCY9143995.1 glycerophosphodiester phosphodiesterase [Bacillus sp. T9C1]
MYTIAHRGVSGYAPENTMAAFDLAAKMNADMIELDVQLTKDRQIVVIHDDRVDRTTNGSGFVKDFTLEELQKLDAGSWYGPAFQGERIPTLEAVLKRYHKKIGFLIELKGHPSQVGIEEEVGQLLGQFSFSANNIVQSFQFRSVQRFHELYPSIPTAVITRPNFGMLSRNQLKACQSIANYVNIKYTRLNRLMIASVHKSGLKVFAWTVNNQKAAAKLQAMGVDGIVTDYPDFIKKDGKHENI